jgi:hypothetical protein
MRGLSTAIEAILTQMAARQGIVALPHHDPWRCSRESPQPAAMPSRISHRGERESLQCGWIDARGLREHPLETSNGE